MKFRNILVLLGVSLLNMASWAQEWPKLEVGADYSYLRFAPSGPYTSGHSLNGGGGSLVYNWNEYLGLKMDLQGYTSNKTGFAFPSTATFPNGLNGNVQGNMFTYLFGPQLKVRAHRIQPFAIFSSVALTPTFTVMRSRPSASRLPGTAALRRLPQPRLSRWTLVAA